MSDTDGKKSGTGLAESDKESCKKAGPVPPKIPPAPEGGIGVRAMAKQVFEFPWILRIIGPKHIAIGRLFFPSMTYYTVAGVLATIYFCDWKAVLQYLPFWNGKYRKEWDEKAAYEAALAKKRLEVIPEPVVEKDPRCP